MEKLGITKLNATNYNSWKFEVELLLIRERLWKFVKSTKPTAKEDIPAWEEGDERARATIGLLMETKQHGLIKPTKTSKEAWDKLRDHFEKPTLTAKISFLKRLVTMRYGEGEDIEKHVGDMEELFERLELAGLKLDEDVQVALVLTSLPPSFNTLTTSLESRADDELTLELIKAKLYDEVAKQGSYEADSALKVGSGKRLVTCFTCQKPGHKQNACPKLVNTRNDGRSDTNDGQGEGAADTRAKGDDWTFKASTVASATRMWVVDSGASGHMCADKKLFKDLKLSSSEFVTLADGKRTLCKGRGTCRVPYIDSEGRESYLNLSDTMYVPGLDANLISVRKLVSKGVRVTFDVKGCTIMKGKRLVFVASIRNGLYALKANDSWYEREDDKNHPGDLNESIGVCSGVNEIVVQGKKPKAQLFDVQEEFAFTAFRKKPTTEPGVRCLQHQRLNLRRSVGVCKLQS